MSENTGRGLGRGRPLGPAVSHFTRPFIEFVKCVHSFNPYNSPMYVVGTISSIYTDEENEPPERLSDLHKVAQLVIGSAQSP